MKKILLVFVLVSLATFGFALDVSAGAGLGVNLSSWPDFKGTFSGNSVEIKDEVTQLDIKVFFDATYLQASIGYMFVHGGTETTTVDGSTSTADLAGNLSYMNFGIFGKLPFGSRWVKFFPLLGIEYRVNLTYTDASGNDLKSGLSGQAQSDLNELWLEAGAGADIALRRFYFRPELLIGFKPLSTTDNSAVTALQALGYGSTSLSYFTVNVEILIGYKL